MKWLKMQIRSDIWYIMLYIIIIVGLLFICIDIAYGEKPVYRSQMLQSLSQYDNSPAYKSFIKSRRMMRSAATAAGFQPVITALPQGASLNTSALVYNNRRYARIGPQPFFSNIGEVNIFNFGK